jgi:hypothetical protein
MSILILAGGAALRSSCNVICSGFPSLRALVTAP